MFNRERGDAPLWLAVFAPDSAEGKSDEFAFGRVGKSSLDMRRSNTRKTSRERCHAERSGAFGQKAGDLFVPVRDAPSPRNKMPHIALVSAPRVRRSRGGEELEDFRVSAVERQTSIAGLDTRRFVARLD